MLSQNSQMIADKISKDDSILNDTISSICEDSTNKLNVIKEQIENRQLRLENNFFIKAAQRLSERDDDYIPKIINNTKVKKEDQYVKQEVKEEYNKPLNTVKRETLKKVEKRVKQEPKLTEKNNTSNKKLKNPYDKKYNNKVIKSIIQYSQGTTKLGAKRVFKPTKKGYNLKNSKKKKIKYDDECMDHQVEIDETPMEFIMSTFTKNNENVMEKYKQVSQNIRNQPLFTNEEELSKLICQEEGLISKIGI